MVQVTNFLLRWLFLCRLVDDRAEVQTWPYRRPGYYEHHHPTPPPPQQQVQQVQQQVQQQHDRHPQQQQQVQHRNDAQPHQHQHEPQHLVPHQHQHHQQQHRIVRDDDDDDVDMPTYRESVIRDLTSYPPGSSERLRRLEELRLETVRRFARHLARADEAIRRGNDDDLAKKGGSEVCDNDFDDRSLDADDSIRDEFRRFVEGEHEAYLSSQHGRHSNNPLKRWNILRGHPDDGERDADCVDPSPPPDRHRPPQLLSPASSRLLLAEARSSLPQLVSAVLHSPPSLVPETPSRPDPISSLRSLLIRRCRAAPSLGIELCWLLEAEVGREWKALFEHRQRAGKRLILFVREDVAAAIATIGAEKASAFNLLQDAEMATAFGAERVREEEEPDHRVDRGGGGGGAAPPPPRPLPGPPRSVSDLRCRHFGDSMHLVDRLTQISLDLRRVPAVHRVDHLRMRLAELNRRLRRRMATRGRISIDVEEDPVVAAAQTQATTTTMPWSEGMLREDMIAHSVHFPMEPECVRWPGGSGDDAADANVPDADGGGRAAMIGDDLDRPPERNGAVRVLRILPEECRVLDSAQRCPFLVRMEVAESGLDADDARLYAGGGVGGGVGATVGEALGTAAVEAPHGGHGGRNGGGGIGEYEGFAPCEVPPELVTGRRQGTSAGPGDDAASGEDKRIHVEGLSKYDPAIGGGDAVPHGPAMPSGPVSSSLSDGSLVTSHSGATPPENDRAVLSRGGYQCEDEGYYGPPPPDMHGTFDMVGEQYYEELHHDSMRHHQRARDEFDPSDPSTAAYADPNGGLATGSALLDRVFGRPWNDECERVRERSPYRNVQGWRLASFIVKAGEDIRREALVMQITSKLWTWFREEIPPENRPFLRPYSIMCVGGDAGLVECLPDVKSVNEVKRGVDGFTTLKEFFERAFGPPIRPPFRPDPRYPQRYHGQQTPNSYGTVSLEKARDNFLRSLVGYSVVCYILQIKDRHNANILMDREGHIMHIDFGFVLGETPKMGKVPLFSERAPFKLSAEFWEVIGGWSAFRRFCTMFEAAYAVASSHSDEICAAVEAAVVNVGRDADAARRTAEAVRGRMRTRADPREQKMHIMEIVNDAITSWGTSTYDWLQRSMHGYQ